MHQEGPALLQSGSEQPFRLLSKACFRMGQLETPRSGYLVYTTTCNIDDDKKRDCPNIDTANNFDCDRDEI